MEMNLGTRRQNCLIVTFVLIFSQIGSSIARDDLVATKKLTQNKKCDVYKGSWIYDESYPLYDSSTCPYIRKEFDCIKFGRQDRDYLKYRWQPSGCDLPRFDGRDFMEKMRGKKILFVGDSVSLDQFESLLCLINSALPQTSVTKQINGSQTTMTFQEYEVSLMLLTSHYLVDIEVEPKGRILKLESLKNGEHWKEMDVLVFNTWLWWNRKVEQPWDFVEYGGKVLKDMDRIEAFRKALITWAKWVDTTVDTTKTRVIFQGITPTHYEANEWNKTGVGSCGNETQPITGSTYPTGLPPAAYAVKEVLNRVRKPVHFLDITTLSQLRKDGHPGKYNVFRGMDCTHWCIAGVQDTWNQLLYLALTSSD